MKHACFACLALGLLVVPPLFAQSGPAASQTGALALLERVSHHYAEAKSYSIKMVRERSLSNPFERSWQKVILFAVQAPGARLHYEAQGSAGKALRIADGKTEWVYHEGELRYTKKPVAESDFTKPTVVDPTGFGLIEAGMLRKSLASLAGRYISAERLPDRSLKIDSRKVRCYVIHVQTADLKNKSSGHSFSETIWIDKAHETILKTVERADIDSLFSGGRIPMKEETIAVYSAAELDTPIPDEMFTFAPPAGAQLVEQFRDLIGGPSLLGQVAPSLKLKSADGKQVSLDSFRGKPVLLDVWATWCEPCVDGLAQLAQIYRETKDKGLVFLSIDVDDDSKTAAEVLSKNKYTWPNFHGEGETEKAIGLSGVPRTILIDATGKVVFDEHSDAGLRAAVARLGPEYEALVQLRPCSVSK
jgi:cytochrome c biogenesis protein CcmG, thiol:disulfide interchange protein DsbE